MSGSDVMIGIPGQSLSSLADDILLLRALDLGMIGVGPFIPHPQMMLGSANSLVTPNADQVPNTELMVYKVMALARPASTQRPRSAGIALGVGSNRSAGVSVRPRLAGRKVELENREGVVTSCGKRCWWR